MGPGPRDCSGTGGREALPGGGPETPSGTPPKRGVRDPPQKGGCRATKQCKFWRVSSVLIQGLCCFLGVRGVSGGGPPGGRVWGGLRGGSQCPGTRGYPARRPARSESSLDQGTLDMRTMTSPWFLRATSGGVARAGGHSARGESSDGDGRVTQQHRGHNLMTSDFSASPGRWGKVRGAWY